MKIDFAGLLAGTLLAASTTVLAAEALPPSLEACSALRRDAERLLCYDKAVASLKAGTAGAPAATAENMFGANSDVLDAPANKSPVKREELKQISGSVTSLHRGDDGMIQIELDNGQVWRQQDADVRLMVSKGDTVTIVRAAMGTFRLTDKSGRFARFRRVR
jgi:hypothetical protein